MIEVLVVMIIIGILAAIAIPMYLGQRDRAKDAAARARRHADRDRAADATSLDSEAEDPWPAACDPATLSAPTSIAGSVAGATRSTAATLMHAGDRRARVGQLPVRA